MLIEGPTGTVLAAVGERRDHDVAGRAFAMSMQGSLPQKLLIPLFLAVGAAVAGVVPLIEDVFSTIVNKDNMVPHSCIDPTRSVQRHIVPGGDINTCSGW